MSRISSRDSICVLNVRQQLLRYGSTTPDYARQFQESEYGAAIALGVKGSF